MFVHFQIRGQHSSSICISDRILSITEIYQTLYYQFGIHCFRFVQRNGMVFCYLSQPSELLFLNYTMNLEICCDLIIVPGRQQWRIFFFLLLVLLSVCDGSEILICEEKQAELRKWYDAFHVHSHITYLVEELGVEFLIPRLVFCTLSHISKKYSN